MPPPSPSGLKELHESDSFFAPFPHADWSTFLSVRRLKYLTGETPRSSQSLLLKLTMAPQVFLLVHRIHFTPVPLITSEVDAPQNGHSLLLGSMCAFICSCPLTTPHVIIRRLPVRKNNFTNFVAPAVALSNVHTVRASVGIAPLLWLAFSVIMMSLSHQDPPLRTGFLPFPANLSGRSSLIPRASTSARWSFGIW